MGLRLDAYDVVVEEEVVYDEGDGLGGVARAKAGSYPGRRRSILNSVRAYE